VPLLLSLLRAAVFILEGESMRFYLGFVLFLLGMSGNNGQAQTIVWSNTGASTAWYTSTNWSPSTSSAQWLTTHVAQFQNAGTATTSGINMNTAPLSIGAIEVTSARTRALTIGNSSTVAGTLTLNGATVNSVANVILRSSSNSALTLQNNETGSGKTMNIALANTTTNLVNIEGTGNIVISSNISGSSKKLAVNASSSGDLRLSGTNTFDGGIDITGGTGGGRLRIDAVAALPTTGNIAISNGGRMTLNIAGTFGSASQSLSFNPNQTTNPSLDISSGAAVIWQGTVSIDAATRIESNGATGSLTFTGNVSGSGQLIKQGSGNLILSGTGNSLTGSTLIGNGTLTVNTGSAIGTGDLTLFQTSTNNTALTLNNTSQSIGSLSSNFTAVTGTQTQTINLNGTALTINNANTTSFGLGAVETLTSTITGSGGSIIKQGAGSLTFTNANTYSGGTTISAGALYANNTSGSATGSGNVIVNGGLLGGTGTINGAVTVNPDGIFQAGDSTATGPLTLGSSLTIASGGQINVKFAGTTSVANNFNITTDFFFNAGAKLQIDGNGLTFDPLQTYQLQIGDAANDLRGLNVTDQLMFSFVNFSNSSAFQFSLTGNLAGNIFVNFTAAPIPEPTTILLGSALVLGGVSYFRRRREVDV
jgi:autotransporter-associated beta strand protein